MVVKKKNEKKIISQTFRGKKYWALLLNGNVLERQPLNRDNTYKKLKSHLDKYGTIELGVLKKQQYERFEKRIVKERPKNPKHVQEYVEYKIEVNGKLYKKTGFGISRKGDKTQDLTKSAKRSAYKHIRGNLASKGLIDYNDKVKLIPVRTSFIVWKPKY